MRGVVLRVVTVLVSRDLHRFSLPGIYLFCLVFLSEGNFYQERSQEQAPNFCLSVPELGSDFHPSVLKNNSNKISKCQFSV